MLQNPYGKDATIGIHARMSLEDAQFLQRLFPLSRGTRDRIVSNLIKLVIDELRSIQSQCAILDADARESLDSDAPVESLLESCFSSGWCIDHPIYSILHAVLSGCSTRKFTVRRSDDGGIELCPSGPDVLGATDPIRIPFGSSSFESPNPECGTGEGGGESRRQETDSLEGDSRAGVSQKDHVSTTVDYLKKLVP